MSAYRDDDVWADDPMMADTEERHSLMEADRADATMNFCESVSAEGHCCVREEGHAGVHQSAICNGTCDICACVEWTDDGEPVPIA